MTYNVASATLTTESNSTLSCHSMYNRRTEDDNPSPFDAARTVVSQTVGGDSWRLSFLVQVDTEPPSRGISVLDTTYSHSRPRLHSATLHNLLLFHFC